MMTTAEIKNVREAEKAVSLIDSLIGVLKNDYDDKKLRGERIESHEGILGRI